MDVTLSYDAENDMFLIYLGAHLMLATASHILAIKQFNHYCDQVVQEGISDG